MTAKERFQLISAIADRALESDPPNGTAGITPEQNEARNSLIESQEIEHLKTGPEKCVLYVHKVRDIRENYTYFDIGLWNGTRIATHVSVGPRRNVGFGFHTYRRAVTCRIFDVLYHGWYMESSGDLVRLRKAKKQ